MVAIRCTARGWCLCLWLVFWRGKVGRQWKFNLGPRTEGNLFCSCLFCFLFLSSSDTLTITFLWCQVLFSICPAIHLLPKEKQNIIDFPSYHAPCYKTSERRGMLSVSVEFDTTKPGDCILTFFFSLFFLSRPLAIPLISLCFWRSRPTARTSIGLNVVLLFWHNLINEKQIVWKLPVERS